METSTWLELVQQFRTIAVIRCAQVSEGQQMAQAAAAGGIRLIEITWNSDRPASLVDRLRADLPECWIGAGTLLTAPQVETAIAAGAQFLFTPHTAPHLIQLANAHQRPIVPGALSPSEIVTAWQAGASSVKVFPVQSVGGAAYIRSLQAPLSGIPLVPTGGVTIANAIEFLQAGAIGVGLAGDLFPRSAIQTGNWEVMTQQAATLVNRVAVWRSQAVSGKR